jgi:phasin
VRQAAEQGLEQTRSTYQKVKAAAEETTSSLETSYSVASRGILELNQKALDAFKAHADATFDHVKAVIAAKSVPEMFTLQANHLRERIEVANEQMKDMASTAQRMANEAVEPLKSSISKRFAA